MKILVAEDDSVTRRLLKISLERWQYQVALASNGAEALDVLIGEDAPKLAILDWVMPGMDGVDVCRALRKRETGSYIYALLLTSKAAKGDLLEGLKAGADDYLIKPFDLLELQARLWTGQRILALQDQLIAAREAMTERATHDALTGVWNRAAILDILAREFHRSGREGRPLSIMMLDLDHFKHINDTRGHQAGDRVLKEAAERVLSVLRAYDALGRYGGEEFLVIAPGCEPAPAMNLAERIRGSVIDASIQTSSGPIPVTLSLGLVNLAADRDPEALLRRADQALYRAKNAGRNRSEAG
ncbi:MAG: diguanylate cyclase response regulator [Acidobacteria bacterium]|nr:MAG: diguanylate cyclase response regulator [Acidobacteriota bacterium]